MSIIQQIIENPTLYGHALFSPLTQASNGVQKAYRDLTQEKEDWAWWKTMSDRITEMHEHPVPINLSELIDLRLNQSCQSERACLKGKSFSYEMIRINQYLIRVKDQGPKIESQLCQKKLALAGRLAIWIVASPFTLTPAIIGIGIKAISHYYFPRKVSFKITQISPEQFPEMAKMARTWQGIATLKDQINGASPILHDNALVAKLIAQCFEHPSQCMPRVFKEAYICRDELDEVQGFLLLKNERYELKIAHVLTHPQNIRSSLNEKEYRRVQGAGSAMVEFAKSRCQQLGLPQIYIEGTETSKEFYEKMGFKEADGTYIEDGCFAMEWTVDKTDSFARSHFKVA